METAIIFIMFAVCLSFALKLSFMKPLPLLGECALIAAATIFCTDFATSQSKTGISSLISSPETMLDVAVILTLDVALQIAFCISMVKRAETFKEKTEREILLYFPGFLILPVMAACLIELIFSCSGIDFYTVSYSLATGIILGLPLLSLILRMLLPSRPMRLELIFYTNCIIALLGIITTVNGRTAVAGINSISLPALGAVTGIFILGAVSGLILHKRKNNIQS